MGNTLLYGAVKTKVCKICNNNRIKSRTVISDDIV